MTQSLYTPPAPKNSSPCAEKRRQAARYVVGLSGKILTYVYVRSAFSKNPAMSRTHLTLFQRRC